VGGGEELTVRKKASSSSGVSMNDPVGWEGVNVKKKKK